jgi:hypothetical protein
VTVRADCADAGDAGPALGPCERVTDSFTAGTNPGGPWSYGTTPTLGAAFTLYDGFGPATKAPPALGWAGLDQWFRSSDQGSSAGPVPDVAYNPTPSPVQPPSLAGSAFTVAPGGFMLVPGPAGDYSIARWTAHAAGAYVVVATFHGLSGDNGLPHATTDVHVRHGAADLVAGYLNLQGAGNDFPVNAPVQVAAGDTIDFAVGNGNGSYAYDITGLTASVCKGQ